MKDIYKLSLIIVLFSMLLIASNKYIISSGILTQPNWNISNLIVLIFVYEILCAIFLFTPSELPLIFSLSPVIMLPKIKLSTIILACSLGKGCGAIVVFFVIKYLRSHFFLKKLEAMQLRNVGIFDKLETYGFPLFFIFQAIPFFPMRTSIYLYSCITNNVFKIFLGSSIGTAIRMVIMLSLIIIGYISVSTIRI